MGKVQATIAIRTDLARDERSEGELSLNDEHIPLFMAYG